MLGLFSGVNKWLIAGIAGLLVIVGTFLAGLNAGTNLAQGQYAKEEVNRLRDEAAVTQAVAVALAKQRPINQYRTQVLEREIVRVPDYSRCKHSDAAFSVLNDALEAKPVTARDLGVSEADTAGGQLLRNNDEEAARSDSNVLRVPSSGRSDR